MPIRKSYKTVVFVSIGLLVFYSCLGFIIIPHALKWILPRKTAPFIQGTVHVGDIRFNPFLLILNIDQCEYRDPQGGRVLGFEGFMVDFQLSSFWSDTWTFNAVSFNKPYVDITLNSEGRLNLLNILPPEDQNPPDRNPAPLRPEESRDSPDKAPKALLISSLQIHGGTLHFRDETQHNPFEVTIQPINTVLEHLSTRMDHASGLHIKLLSEPQGSLTLQGSCTLESLACHSHIKIASLSLLPVQPYIENAYPLQFQNGILDLNGEITYRAAQEKNAGIRFAGNMRLGSLQISDPLSGQELFGWKDLILNHISFSLYDKSLTIQDILLDKPAVHAVLEKEGQLNFERILAPSGPKQKKPKKNAPAAAGQAPEAAPQKNEEKDSGLPFYILIQNIKLAQGHISFTDRSTRPVFEAALSSFNLKISPLSSDKSQRSDFKLNSALNQTGALQIDGFFCPLDLAAAKALNVSLQDYQTTEISPYFGKYLGYAVDHGLLNLNVTYDILPDQFSGAHRLILDKFTLGEKVDSPEAVNVPIKLALSLLEDSRQQIDLSVPVKGDPSSPEFDFKQIVFRAFKNIFTKIITAPFSVLAGLAGSEDTAEPLDFISFQPGLASISDDQKAKILKIAAALKNRPKLVLEMQGVYDPETDVNALKKAAFQADYTRRMEESSKPREFVLEQMYKKHVGWRAITELRDKYRKEARKRNSRIIDKESFYQELRKQLIEQYQVETEILKTLSAQRVENIKDILVDQGQLTEDRVQIKNNAAATSAPNQIIKLQLSLSSL